MAAITDELMLLERVFLRLGTTDTDEQLQASVCKFLPPVLLKLSSAQEGVRKKVMELLIHINRRVKSRSKVQLPVESLLLQYQDPTASSFVINFTVIYIKLGYPRMNMNKQADLIPSVLNAIEGKPVSHQDSLMLIIMPALGHVNIPIDPEKRASFLGLQDKPHVAKQLISFMLDMMLLPYGSVSQAGNKPSDQAIDWSEFPVPPGLSDYAFKRVIGEIPPTTEQLEQTKLGILKFLTSGCVPDSDIFIHLIVAAADTRFTVANMADLELKKIVTTLDWSSMQLALPLYTLFLGTDALATQKELKAEMKRLPASTRIRLKLLHYLCRVKKAGFIIPPCIQVVFDSLHGSNTNPKLKSLALQFTSNIVQQCTLEPLARVAGVILYGMMNLVSEADDVHKVMAYTIIGQLGQRIPSLINKDSNLLRHLFETLVSTEGDLRRAVRDTLISVTSAFVLSKDDETNIGLMNDLLSTHIESTESSVRFVAMHYAATVFPEDDVPSRYLLLLACGDNKHEIRTEAIKALYGVGHKNEDDKVHNNVCLPDFPKLATYIDSKIPVRMSASSSAATNIGGKQLAYNIANLAEIISYLRVCLAKSANVDVHSAAIQHPCENTPLIGRYLEHLYKDQAEIVNNYVDRILLVSHASADEFSLQALLEVIGCIPQHVTKLCEKELPWLCTLIMSTKPDIRQLAARIYGTITAQLPTNDFESHIFKIMDIVDKQNLEAQHGALLTLTYMMERNLILWRKKNDSNLLNWEIYSRIVKTICTFLHQSALLLMDAAIESVGVLGKTLTLPLPDDGDQTPNKKAIVEDLFSVLNNVTLNTKIKEKAALSLGYLCVGENFPYTRQIVEKIMAMVKETKDVQIHLIMGEALVCCVQCQASPEGRDAWTTLPSEHKIPYSNESTELLIYTLDELLDLYKEPHPNSRQAVCVWLLALLKHNIQRKCVMERLPGIHCAFMDFLSEDSDIVQDIAAKGLSLIHINSTKEEREALVRSILDQFTQGRRSVQQVTPDTKLFEEGQLGKSPSNGGLSTYKELCALATELQKPDLVYYFMHLANHNAVWTSKKGAAFGFAAIAKIANDELTKHLPNIIPRLYRYQFDPTPKIQQSMSSIWRAIVPSTSKAIEQYDKEILQDITENVTCNEWRVRISCCNALADLLRSNAELDLVESAPELWMKLFRVMDDIHEGTRLAATNTTTVLSKVCIRYCNPTHGKEGEDLIRAILPILLGIGVIHPLNTVRSVSLQTVSQLVSTAGTLLKDSLIILIPALLTTIGESENPKLSYWSNVCGGTSQTQDAIDSIRATAAKGHYAAETITKCIQYIDADILKKLMPKVIELSKCSVGFGTKIACSHFLILLSIHTKEELQPHVGKLLNVLVNGLSDRNSAVRKNNAVAIGHIVGSGKKSALEKLFTTLSTWYMDQEDDSIKLSVGQTLQAINNYNSEILRNYSNLVMPLVFFAMHARKTQDNEATIELWTNLWIDIAHGTESGIRKNLEPIISILRSSLKSASWNTKVQAANAVYTLAERLGNSMDAAARDDLLKLLTDALRGRTWNGKERLLNALAILACNSKQALHENPELFTPIIETLQRESKKEALEYRRHALQAFAMVLHELDIDMFTDVYDIAQNVLVELPRNDDENDNDSVTESAKRKEEMLKLQETVYEILGKAWPTSKDTQDTYCIEFVTHCHKALPNSTRTVQVLILATLNLFIDKLALLKISKVDLTINNKKMLDSICDTLYKILQYCLGISKYTKIRKEALNIILSLGRKLRNTNNIEHLDNIAIVFKEFLPELTQDNQPEIRTRVMDIKQMLEK